MTSLISRNVVVGGRRTSMRLEPEMWEALEEVCAREGMAVNEFCTKVDKARGRTGLTTATRVFLLIYYRAAATDEGHARARNINNGLQAVLFGDGMPQRRRVMAMNGGRAA